jgi:hypothetical protein
VDTQVKRMSIDDCTPDEWTASNPWATQVGGTHYKELVIQPVEFSMKNNLNTCQANVIKYVCRKKGGRDKVIEDRLKAIHYLELEIDLLRKGVI